MEVKQYPETQTIDERDLQEALREAHVACILRSDRKALDGRQTHIVAFGDEAALVARTSEDTTTWDAGFVDVGEGIAWLQHELVSEDSAWPTRPLTIELTEGRDHLDDQMPADPPATRSAVRAGFFDDLMHRQTGGVIGCVVGGAPSASEQRDEDSSIPPVGGVVDRYVSWFEVERGIWIVPIDAQLDRPSGSAVLGGPLELGLAMADLAVVGGCTAGLGLVLDDFRKEAS